jgi:hypothetical protein
MCEEKRNDDRPAEGGTLNSGRRMAPDVGEIYLQRPNDFQPIEGVAKSHQESDLPIVVRDGNTDHTAKDQAGRRMEILWCDRQLRTTLGLRLVRQAIGFQMAQPPQPAAQLQLDQV